MGYNIVMAIVDISIGLNKRECGTCTKCCDGWLKETIHGYPMYPGKPCFFVQQGVGCRNYENRPEKPCKTFTCSWITTPDMPYEFKPEFSNVIISKKDFNGFKAWSVNKAPGSPSAKLLSWLLSYAVSRRENVVWMIDNELYFLGHDDFCKEMQKYKK
jgi:hypothetical protein